MPDHGEVVADEEIGEAELVLQVAHQIEDLRLYGNVQRRRRLIADDEFGFRRQRPRDSDPLPLAAGKFVGVLPAIVRVQADKAQQFADARLDVALALDQVEGADWLGHDGIDPEARVEACVRVLKDHLNAAAQLLTRLQLPDIAHRDAVDDDFARRRRQQSDDHPGNRGLSRTGFANQGKRLALPDVEGDAIDRLQEFQMAALKHPVEPRF